MAGDWLRVSLKAPMERKGESVVQDVRSGCSRDPSAKLATNESELTVLRKVEQ